MMTWAVMIDTVDEIIRDIMVGLLPTSYLIVIILWADAMVIALYDCCI